MGDKLLQVPEGERVVRLLLRSDRRCPVAADSRGAERAAGVAGIDLGLVRKLQEPLQRVEQVLGALLGADGEVGPGRVPDQQRVAGQKPALDQVAAVLRPVARRVQDADAERADQHLLAVLDRIERVLRLGEWVHRNGHAVLERQPPVPGDVVGVGVRLQHPHDAEARALRLLQIRLDRVGGVYHGRLAAVLVADQVGRAAEIVVDALEKDQCDKR